MTQISFASSVDESRGGKIIYVTPHQSYEVLAVSSSTNMLRAVVLQIKLNIKRRACVYLFLFDGSIKLASLMASIYDSGGGNFSRSILRFSVARA